MSLPLPAEPHAEVEWLTLAQVPLAVVKHAGLRIDDLRHAFDSSFGAIGAAIGEGRVQPAGPAVALYRGDPAGEFDLSIGFPLEAALTNGIEQDGITIEHDAVAPGAYAAASHVGGYDGLGAAWERLVAAVAEGGARPAGEWVEIYVTEPSPQADPATMRTDLLVATVLDEAR